MADLEEERRRIEREREEQETARLIRRYGCVPLHPAEDDTPPRDESPAELFKCSSPLCPGRPLRRWWGGKHAQCVRLEQRSEVTDE